MRECTGCRKEKRDDAFSVTRTPSGGQRRETVCKKCKAEYQRDRQRAQNESGERTYADRMIAHRARQMRLSEDEYIAAQHAPCEVCDREAEEGALNYPYRNRRTGSFQGTVCPNCSRAIGYLGHDPNRAHALVAFLISKPKV